ncbi:transporter [Bacillus glycinifermentans]|uniref:MDR family MFS transporter n=1 Tax=Bacillus glycinifermentans TaxID=1664069 RepID=UPI0006528D82|nr:MFS transporter [Bacillus glycinifermentans]ATH92281.1 MFS transporter [Bacillus glycinifermentans]KMM58587.1 transporter [Bacillus glycinifermentans]MEC0494539.1 MFS transporter [Bacillus glycinifermentans]MEC0541317.1 MFS transporter [Bacillus glycinifermentans]
MKPKWKEIHPLSWTIIAGTIFGRMGTAMSIPFLAIYLTQVKGASAGFAGAVIAASSLVGIAASFYGGYVSDRFGRKTIMLLSIFGWTLVFVGFALADNVWTFFLMNALNGLCRALFEPTSRALLSDVSKPDTRLFVFNLRYTAINLGVVFGPLLGLYLGSSKTTMPFLIAGLIYFVYAAVLAVQFKKHTVPVIETNKRIKMQEAFQVTKTDRVFSLTLIGSILCLFGYSHFTSTLAQYMSASPFIEGGTEIFGMMLTLNAVAVLVTQYPLVHIAKRFSPILSLMTGNVLITASLFSLSFFHDVLSIVFIVVLFTIGEVLLFSMLDVLVDQIAPPELKGTYFGAMGFTQLGSVIGPWAGGMLLDVFGAEKPFFTFSILSVVTLFGIPFLAAAFRNVKNAKYGRPAGKTLHH